MWKERGGEEQHYRTLSTTATSTTPNCRCRTPTTIVAQLTSQRKLVVATHDSRIYAGARRVMASDPIQSIADVICGLASSMGEHGHPPTATPITDAIVQPALALVLAILLRSSDDDDSILHADVQPALLLKQFLLQLASRQRAHPVTPPSEHARSTVRHQRRLRGVDQSLG